MDTIRKEVVIAACFLGLTGLLRAEASSSAFFPMQKGTQWVYNTIHKEDKKSFEMKVVIQDPWKEDGDSGMIMTQKDQRGTMRQFFLINDKGVFLHKLG